MEMEIATKLSFESAHHLPNLPENHKCHRLHGHNYVIEVVARGKMDEGLGWVIDYGLLDAAIRECVIDVCDHRLLNDIEGLENPTGENIALWALSRLQATVSQITEVTIWETPHYRATARA